MESISEAISTIIKLFVGKDGWRFWIAACLVSWLITIRENFIWSLYVAIFCSVILLLLFITWCNNYISASKRKIELRKTEEKNKIALLNRQKADEFEYKNFIWKFFAVVDKQKLDMALELLNFQKIENNECSRFISRDIIESQKIGNALWNVVVSMRIHREPLSSVELIVEEQTPYGIYLHFEKYFMTLLLHYKESGKREFI